MSAVDNIKIFEDTKRLYENDSSLVNCIKRSISCQVVERNPVECHVSAPFSATNLIVSKKRSFESASVYARKGQKTCVLNFASAVSPGGGVIKGSTAQEESLCRVSTLYPCLVAMVQDFYTPHKQAINSGKMDASYNADCIYTPDVRVFKTDTSNPQLMNPKDWFDVDVVTCAAPNLRVKPSNQFNQGGGKGRVVLSQSELLTIHMERGNKILSLAVNNGCEVVILGAFGCGAFQNPSNVVVEAYRRLLKDWVGMFGTIEFAVYCSSRDTLNYDTFNRVLCGGKGLKVLKA